MKILLALLIASVGHATLTFTPGTACHSATGVSSQTCLVGSVTAGNTVWIGLSWAGGGGSHLTVTDGVNTYTQAGTDAQAGTTSAKSSIWVTTASTSVSLTVTATADSSSPFISISPAVVTGSWLSHETLKATSTSSQTCTLAFTRLGSELMTIAGNHNVAGADVGWTTAGSTGTFTLGAIVSNGNLFQPLGTAYQYVTTGTTINAILAVTASAGGHTCSGFSMKEAGTDTIVMGHGSGFVQ